MALVFETLVGEDIDLGTGQVSKTAPGGGTLNGTQVSISTLGLSGASTSAVTSTWDPGSVPATQAVTNTVTVQGAQLGDLVLTSFSLSLGGLTLSSYVSSANTVTVVLSNHTTAAVDLSSGTLRVLVLRPR